MANEASSGVSHVTMLMYEVRVDRNDSHLRGTHRSVELPVNVLQAVTYRVFTAN